MTRRDEKTYGIHGATVHFWIEDGRCWVEYRLGAKRKTKSWPEEHAPAARRWAMAFAAERAKMLRAEGPVPTIAEVWERYRKADGPTWRPKTAKLYAGWAKALSVITKPIDTLRHDDADAFRDRLRAKKIAHGTIRRTLGFLRQLLNFAVGRQIITANPLAAYRYRVPKDERDPAPAEYSREELQKIAAALDWPEQWRARNVIRLCASFGARINAILKLRWEDVDFDAGVVTFRSQWDKTGEQFSRPMTGKARGALLEAYQQRNDSGWVFWSRFRPTKPLHYNGLHWHLLEAEKRAGVPHIPKRAFHGARRSIVTDIGSLEKAAEWLNQKDITTTAGYIRPRVESIDATRLQLERREGNGK